MTRPVSLSRKNARPQLGPGVFSRPARFIRSWKAQLRGRRAEIVSCDFLRASGYRIVETNVRLARGELDILARKGDLLVAVEVRSRGPRGLVGAFASVTVRKRRRCRSALEAVWKSYAADLSIRRVRFDVHGVYLDGRAVAVEVAEGVSLF